MSSHHFFHLHFQLFQLPFHHFFNKLFTPFLVVVIDIGTKHNLYFPIGYRKVCCSSTFAMGKRKNSAAVTTFCAFFHQNTCGMKNSSYFCSTRTRQASQRCSNVRVVLFLYLWIISAFPNSFFTIVSPCTLGCFLAVFSPNSKNSHIS